ncbi:MAG: fluoride efflux transporter CrcB [Candidatus Omnitrophica bacterium]|nr:fluoride efflux transporter CrcB [Candidatus Omnitrophota bacterium]MDD5574639.1 fluoride efflux transporter CrcB [Candidatus Omnitrophota bacterium]
MVKLILIALGGALGAVARYIVSGLDYKYSYGIFPISTFVVNLTGSLLIGLLWGLSEVVAVSSNTRMFIFIGVLGGFTTFSTYALENFNLWRDGEHAIALVNIFLSNILGIAMVFAGYWAARMIINFAK